MKAQIYNYSLWIKNTNPEQLEERLRATLYKAGFIILDKMDYHFEPQGYTLLFMLGESHLAAHTFPEENSTYIELSSCVKKPFDAFISKLISEKVLL